MPAGAAVTRGPGWISGIRICFPLVVFFFILTAKGASGDAQLSAVHSRVAVKTGTSLPPSTLVVYDHNIFVGPNRTQVTSASPSGNATDLKPEFGSIDTYSSTLYEDWAGQSPEIGSLNGVAFYLPNLSTFNTYTIVINTTRYSGTISVQGILDPRINGELTIMGGTGDFRWATGYVSTRVGTPGVTFNPEDFFVQSTFHLKYDRI